MISKLVFQKLGKKSSTTKIASYATTTGTGNADKPQFSPNEMLLKILEKAEPNRKREEAGKDASAAGDALLGKLFNVKKDGAEVAPIDLKGLLGEKEEEEEPKQSLREFLESLPDDPRSSEAEQDVDSDVSVPVYVNMFTELDEYEEMDFARLIAAVNFEDDDHKKTHKSIDQVCALISRALRDETDGSLSLSKFLLSDEYYLREVDFGDVALSRVPGWQSVFCFNLLVSHTYLFKLSEAEFDEYVKYLNRYFLQKFNLKSSNLRVRITSIHGDGGKVEPFVYFNHGKKPIKFLPSEISELMDLSSLSLPERHQIEHWFAHEKYQTALNEFIRDDLQSIVLDREQLAKEGMEIETVDTNSEEVKQSIKENGSLKKQTARLFYERLAKLAKEDEEAEKERMPGGADGPEKQPGPAPDEEEIKTQDYGQDWAKHERFARFVADHKAGRPPTLKRTPKKYAVTPADAVHALYDELDRPDEEAVEIEDDTPEALKAAIYKALEQEEPSEEENVADLPQPDVLVGGENQGNLNLNRLPPGYAKVTQFHHKYFTAQEPFIIRFEITPPTTEYDDQGGLSVRSNFEEDDDIEFFVKKDRYSKLVNRF